MAAQSEGGGKDEIKTQFATREGVYKLMTHSEYARPNKSVMNGGNTPVKISFIQLKDKPGQSGNFVGNPNNSHICDHVCFNVGKELYMYSYNGLRKAADLTKPIDKRVYKATLPTCHDFNEMTATSQSVWLVIGFTMGQIQLIDPICKNFSRLFNEHRNIDKTKVTCVKWIPGTSCQFLAAHASGEMFVYSQEVNCCPTAPSFTIFKQGEGFAVMTCKSRSTRNPLYRWCLNSGAINQFAFSPCSQYLAVVCQNGALHIFDYSKMEQVGAMKSYFGGLTCVAWSPDSKYVVVGGEDDLVTVWSHVEKRVVCRGEGHRSWVNAVAFDSYASIFADVGSLLDHDEQHSSNHRDDGLSATTLNSTSKLLKKKETEINGSVQTIVSYRFGSIGQDTAICLWDLTEDILRQPLARQRSSTIISQTNLENHFLSSPNTSSNPQMSRVNSIQDDSQSSPSLIATSPTVSRSLTQKFATLALGEKKEKKDNNHQRSVSLSSKSGGSNNIKSRVVSVLRELGTRQCPRLEEVAILEPLVCKKVAHERLTALVFREDCIVTSCHEGYIWTWARPGKLEETACL